MKNSKNGFRGFQGNWFEIWVSKWDLSGEIKTNFSVIFWRTILQTKIQNLNQNYSFVMPILWSSGIKNFLEFQILVESVSPFWYNFGKIKCCRAYVRKFASHLAKRPKIFLAIFSSTSASSSLDIDNLFDIFTRQLCFFW